MELRNTRNELSGLSISEALGVSVESSTVCKESYASFNDLEQSTVVALLHWPGTIILPRSLPNSARAWPEEVLLESRAE
jgi:hypothetical protein